MRRKAIVVTFSFLALLSLGAGVIFDDYLSKNSPREPKPEEGRIYPAVVNKARVYLTRTGQMASYLPASSFFTWFVAVLYFGVRWKVVQVPMKGQKASAPTIKKKKLSG